MMVAPGFYRWITEGIRLVDEDERFLCLNSILQEPERDRGSVGAKDMRRNPRVAAERRGEKFLPGFAVRRRVVEAMLRFWPMSKRDVDWDILLEHWAGSEPCLSPARAMATHARASDLSVGGDLPPMPPVGGDGG
ncbi:uncharacterized protein LOC122248912 [Penaeus japonicus]|uniref:uncharacterized protein LOC122248912 n=1 Tax=Penaeus japonicus TaxID=27405 RepID=UPI001C716788|nr:uncharacterized protein LOC122248912 [Penaeus japonicus]